MKLTTFMRKEFNASPSQLFSSGNFTRTLVAGILLLNLVVIGLAGLAIYEDKLEHEARSRVTTQNISLLIERETSAALDRIDLGLQSARDEIEEQIDAGPVNAERVNAFLKRHQSYLPEIMSLQVTDANGLVRYGKGVPAGAMVDLSDHEYFILQRSHPKAGPVIGKPRARISQEWAVPVSRRLSLPNGEFAGIVYVDIPVAYFVRKFSVLNLGSHGLVALRSEILISEELCLALHTSV
ncbi:MAG: hypothetical protein Q8M01_02990 [Rubrivivax sp.]|nr:hypothetical protein [Rubrivivax sp.]